MSLWFIREFMQGNKCRLHLINLLTSSYFLAQYVCFKDVFCLICNVKDTVHLSMHGHTHIHTPMILNCNLFFSRCPRLSTNSKLTCLAFPWRQCLLLRHLGNHMKYKDMKKTICPHTRCKTTQEGKFPPLGQESSLVSGGTAAILCTTTFSDHLPPPASHTS